MGYSSKMFIRTILVIVVSAPTQWTLITATASKTPSAAVSTTASPAPSEAESIPESLAPLEEVLTSASSPTASNGGSIELKNTSGTEELVMKFIFYLKRTDFQQENSLQDVSALFQKTIEQFKNGSFQEGRQGFIFKATIAFENFVLNYGQYHLNESKPLLNKVYSTLDLRIQRVFSRNASDFHLEGSEKQNFINIPSSNFHDNGSVLVGIVYRTLHEVLRSTVSNDHTTKDNRKLDTMIMAATMDPKPEQLQQNVILNFRNLKVADGERFCVFWSGYSEKNPEGWSGEGCHVVRSKSNSKATVCSCNHMSHFAALYNHGGRIEIVKEDEKLHVLTILSYVGFSLSIVGLILTIIAYARLTDAHQPLSQIRMNLAGSLGAGQVIFLASINATENTGACVAEAALMQYFLMAAFCWMLVEGIYLYLFVVKVSNINNKITTYYVISWGFPAVMVAVSLSIAAAKGSIQSFVSDEYCWMSPNSKVIWMFVAFLVMIEVLNLLLLVRVIREMTTMQPTGENHVQQIRVGIKAYLILIPLLVVTWLFGLLSPFHKAFAYIFTILNSTQGFLIFHLHCVRNTQIRDRFKNAIFPAVNHGQPAKKTSQVNRSDVGAATKIEVQPCSDSVFELN